MKVPAKIDIDRAAVAVKEYSEKHLLDYSRIDYISQTWDEVLFGIWKKNVEVNGLLTDIATQPDIVLEYKMDGSISETERIHLLD